MAYKWISALPGVRYREHPTRRMRNGRADRYFAIRYYDAASKQHEEGLGWASEGWTADKAQSVLGKLKEAVRTGQGPQSLAALRESNAQRLATELSAADDITLADFFDSHYLPVAQKRKRTWSHDKGRFDKGIRPRLGDVPFRGLTRQHMDELMDSLRKDKLAESTILQYIAVMRQLFSLAKITRIGTEPLWPGSITPIDEILLPSTSEERDRFLEYHEADILIAAAATLPVDDSMLDTRADLVDLIRLALNTGLRFGELIRLEWADISLNHAFLTVRMEKQRKPGGKVPLNAEALEVLRARNSTRAKAERCVFPPERAHKDGWTLRHLYTEAVEVSGLNADSTCARTKVVFHTLRHTFGSWLALAGTDIYRIKNLMRHKTITMTMRYAHLLPDATRDAVEQIRPKVSHKES